MITPEEWIEKKCSPAWIHGLDILDHCLKGDESKTAYKDTHPDFKYLRYLRRNLGERSEKRDFRQILEDTYRRDFKTIEVPSEFGELNIDAYLNRDELIFEEPEKRLKYQNAVNLVFDMSIPWREREYHEVEERHKNIYRATVKYEGEDIPCRVICALGISIPERYGQDPLKIYSVIKDYSDPIFPGIWGAIRNNADTNSFVNVIMDFMVGTRCGGNGTPTEIRVKEDFPEDEEVIILDAKRVKL